MNYVWLSHEQRREICEDLLCIIAAGRWHELVSLRRRMVREHCPPTAWQQLDADRLARDAAVIIGGNRGYWREAAASALGIQSRSDVSIEAVCTLADDVRQEESQRATPRARLTIGSRKRGGR